jgi:hypothetical protein
MQGIQAYKQDQHPNKRKISVFSSNPKLRY